MTIRSRRRRTVLAMLLFVAAMASAACGKEEPTSETSDKTDESGTDSAGDGDSEENEDASDESAEGDDESTTTLPPGAVAGLDDYAGDGELDPTCGTRDYGGGLVMRIPCEVSTPQDPPEGVTLVEGSLYRLNGSIDIPLDGISGSVILGRDEAGTKVVIVTNNSDALFTTGSDQIGSTDTLDNTIRLINERWPNTKMQVRGHTDSTGSASANQSLSERRAARVKDYMASHGIKVAELTSVGFGSTQPFAVETNDDGRAFNRRVEIVLRVP